MNTTTEATVLTRLLIPGTVLLVSLKVFFAVRLDLYSDEIFYWLASTNLALSYSDLPFMTSLLVWLGSALGETSTLAVRSPFILMGSSLPLLVYWLALPVTGRQQALFSALLALCIPLGGFLGLLAVPDVPLLFFGVLAIALFERALRTDRLTYWLLTGIVVALGLSTHYRFFLYPLAAIIFLLWLAPRTNQFKNPRLWLAAGISALGLIPIIWFNLNNQLASASFYLVERHPWDFQAGGLLHVFKQAGLVTPPLYILLAITLWQLLKRARRNDQTAALLASFALVNLLVYLVLAPWTDASSTSIHWPLSGYFPLLVHAPATIDSLFAWSRARGGERAARALAIGIPALGFVGSMVAILAIGSQAFQAPLQTLLGPAVLSNKMAGWREFSAYTADLLQDQAERSPLIVTDNYYTAAQVKFAGLSESVFTLDDDKAVKDGRRLQMALWNMDDLALSEFSGAPVLFISEDSTLTVPDKELVMASICRQVNDLHQIANLSLFKGEKRFSYYQAGHVVEDGEQSAAQTHTCPYPARAWLEPPLADARLSGVTHIEGWAYNEDIGLTSVRLLLDGDEILTLQYAIPRPDVVAVMGVRSDPNAPKLGYAGELDTRSLDNGEHTIAVRLTDSRGVLTDYGHRRIYIEN